jgi:hypothetical protein
MGMALAALRDCYASPVSSATMNFGRFYDPPFLLKMVLLVSLVLIGIAHRKGWMNRTMGEQRLEQKATMAAPSYEIKTARK